jgi:hypothetical protein
MGKWELETVPSSTFSSACSCGAFLPGTDLLAVGSPSGLVRFLSARDGSLVATTLHPVSPDAFLTFRPDNLHCGSGVRVINENNPVLRNGLSDQVSIRVGDSKTRSTIPAR